MALDRKLTIADRNIQKTPTLKHHRLLTAGICVLVINVRGAYKIILRKGGHRLRVGICFPDVNMAAKDLLLCPFFILNTCHCTPTKELLELLLVLHN